ncbi:alpha/beta hydrolase [Pedobacter sp. JCM 36344]|uniref:alpha/beta hydrolase n=1 Tax=Pedobacter sp. JCM 36344 TaxID=3374280 RepID=UPI00397B150B
MNVDVLIPQIVKTEHALKSVHLERDVEFDVFLPYNLLGNEELNLLLLNDGQDSVELKIQETLSDLYSKGIVGAILVVAIKASEERLHEYGIVGRPDFINRGAKAAAYSSFVAKELFPLLAKIVSFPIKGSRAFAGFSLGGLSAFDIVWNNEALFNIVGVMSGSFWWRKKDLKYGYTDSDRIMHEVIRESPIKPNIKFWLMTGTEDEKADRNKNGIIDSIDDTIDIIKELIKKGYQRPEDIRYYEMVGGEHNVATWSKALPAFLKWAFPAKRL